MKDHNNFTLRERRYHSLDPKFVTKLVQRGLGLEAEFNRECQLIKPIENRLRYDYLSGYQLNYAPLREEAMLQQLMVRPIKNWLNDAVLALFAILLTTIYSAQRIALYDYSFMANIGHRLALGQIPYRDFDLPLPIGSFVPLFLLEKIPGINNLLAIYVTSCLTVGISTLTALRILRIIQKSNPSTKMSIWLQNTCKLGLVIANVISHSPNYFYDSLSSTFVLLSILFSLKYLEENNIKYLHIIGWTLGWAFISKYNIGAALGLAICFWIIGDTYSSTGSRKEIFRNLRIICTPALVLLFISVSFAPKSYFFQTILAPGENKKVFSFSQLAQYNYKILVLILLTGILGLFLPKIQGYMQQTVVIFLGCALLILVTARIFGVNKIGKVFLVNFPNLGFVFPVIILMSFFLLIHKESIISSSQKVIILLSSAAMLGSFLSQGWNGSTYAFYPELIILLFSNSFTNSGYSIALLKTQIHTLVVITLVIVNATLMIVNGDRLGFLVDQGSRSTTPNFNILGTALSNSDVQNIRVVQEVITTSGVTGTLAEFPAEDPISLMSDSLKPWFRCIQFTFICPTISEEKLESEFRNRPPDIIILKRESQINFKIEPIFDKVQFLARKCFENLLENRTYSVYRKGDNSQLCMKENQ